MILLDEEKSRCQRKLSTWETLDFKAELISDPDLTFHGDRDLFHEILTARNGISSVDDHDLKTTTCECNLGKKRRFSCDFRQTSPPSGCSALSLRCIRSLSASELVTRDAKNVLSDNPLVKWFYEPEVMVAEKNRAKCKLAPCNARIRRPSFGLRCHQHADSLFSTSSGFTNYRGMLNLCVILLAVSMGRVALENIIKYGILINPVQWLHVFLHNPYSWPSVCIVISLNLFILAAFQVECLLSKNVLTEKQGLTLHIILLTTEVILPAGLVLHIHPNPCFSSPALAICVMAFLKLVSYAQVNKWCRLNLPTNRLRNKRLRRKSLSDPSEFTCGDGIDETKNGRPETLKHYPNNLTLEDLYYFMFAPTLCYQLNFPRSARIRKRFLLKRLIEMIFLSGLMLSLIQQWIIPIVNNSLVPFEQSDLGRILERLLKLAVPNLFIWLVFFYWWFHSCLNVTAELLQFGDRVFYRDWWNAETVASFWQNWNIPVHKWASRHVYKPMLGAGFNNLQASVTVFLVSAFFHEYLVSIPLKMFRLWAFSAMLLQVPLAIITGKYLQGKMGNMVMWLSLIIGQPVAILMYYHDYYIMHVVKQ